MLDVVLSYFKLSSSKYSWYPMLRLPSMPSAMAWQRRSSPRLWLLSTQVRKHRTEKQNTWRLTRHLLRSSKADVQELCAVTKGSFLSCCLLTPVLLLSQTPERRASCSATLKKPLSLELWIWMREQKMELVGVMKNSSSVVMVLTPATLFHLFLFFFKMAQWT